MGSVLDSTAVIAAERRRQTALQLMESVPLVTGDAPVVLSAIAYTGLLNGLHRDA